MTLAEIPPATASGNDGYLVKQIDPDEDRARHPRPGDEAALPDAVFHLATLPSTTAHRAIHNADYRLVRVPFADALRLSAVFRDPMAPVPEGEIERHNVFETLIPPFTSQIEPAVPAAVTSTIGAPVYLIGHDAVSNAAVETAMEAVFDSRFARLHELIWQAMPRRTQQIRGQWRTAPRSCPPLTADKQPSSGHSRTERDHQHDADCNKLIRQRGHRKAASAPR